MAVNVLNPLAALPALTALEVMRDAPVIPVIVTRDARQAVLLARALVAGGIRMLELTLRTPEALACIAAIHREVEGAVIGAGTVKNALEVDACVKAGARFLVSPGYTSALGQACRAANLPLLPGVATAAEIMAVLDDGLTEAKFFPAMQAGGPAMLKAWGGPFGEVRFCPTGGVTQANAADFLALPNVVCVGGSWLTPPELLARGDWAAVTQLAREAKGLQRAM
jgi:2-dehydro-3-deoxyphosphogluconate aldolase / (4S)-4-hydroxy-2-oxoglutarate aldolase